MPADRGTPVADALIDFTLGLDLRALPDAVTEAASLCLTDWVGAGVRGSAAAAPAAGPRPRGGGAPRGRGATGDDHRPRSPDQRAARRAGQRRPGPRARLRRHPPGLDPPRLRAPGAPPR